jgi:hypothetical protein
VDGDVLVSGGEVIVGGVVTGDVMAAGGEVKIRGDMKDDIRAAGGQVELDATVGDDIALAGGSVQVSRNASAGGRAFLAGGEVRVDGKIGRDLKVGGGLIRIAGQVKGNVELWGDRIIIEPDAVIDGNLLYHSMKEAKISDRASIKGSVTFDKIEREYGKGILSMLLGWLMLIFAGVALNFLFPAFTARSSLHIRKFPWQSIGLGFAIMVLIPVLIAVSMIVVVGVWVGLAMLALYPVLLLGGYLIGLFSIGDFVAGLLKQEIAGSMPKQTLFFSLALAVAGIVWLIPLLGGLINCLILLAGTGSISMNIRKAYTGGTPT